MIGQRQRIIEETDAKGESSNEEDDDEKTAAAAAAARMGEASNEAKEKMVDYRKWGGLLVRFDAQLCDGSDTIYQRRTCGSSNQESSSKASV